MAELVLELLALGGPVALWVAGWSAWRLWPRQRRGCGHARYHGRAGVTCLACRRVRERIAGHLSGATASPPRPRLDLRLP